MSDSTPLRPQPADVPWPTLDWPTGSLARDESRRALAIADELFADSGTQRYGETLALVAVQRGALVLERYAAGVEPDDTQRSWSMAKSITHALTGILVGDGRLDVHDLAPVPEWRDPGDPRSRITIEHLLRMIDGLDFVEEYIPGEPSHVIDMLFQSGRADTAAYARRRPSAHEPGTFWNYSSGTTNILSAILGEVVGDGPEGMARFMRERLFAPIGMTSAQPRFDEAGTLIGSSFVFATPRDFLRFGLLYLRDGVWDGERLLPEGWVDHARSVTPASGGEYGAHWWTARVVGSDTLAAVGYEGQYLIVDPSRDLLVLRLGRSTPEQRERVEQRLGDLVAGVARSPRERGIG